jgi:hypothetical protein
MQQKKAASAMWKEDAAGESAKELDANGNKQMGEGGDKAKRFMDKQRIPQR